MLRNLRIVKRVSIYKRLFVFGEYFLEILKEQSIELELENIVITNSVNIWKVNTKSIQLVRLGIYNNEMYKKVKDKIITSANSPK